MSEKKKIDYTEAQQELHQEINSSKLNIDKSCYKKSEQERIALKVAKAEAKKRLK
jgi:hypothetical protein